MLLVGLLGFVQAGFHVLGGLAQAGPLGVGVHRAERGNPVVQRQLAGGDDAQVAGVVAGGFLADALADFVVGFEHGVVALSAAAGFLQGPVDALRPLLRGFGALLQGLLELGVAGIVADFVGRTGPDFAAGLHGGQALLDEGFQLVVCHSSKVFGWLACASWYASHGPIAVRKAVFYTPAASPAAGKVDRS